MSNIEPTKENLEEARAFNKWFNSLSEKEKEDYVKDIEADMFQEENIQEP